MATTPPDPKKRGSRSAAKPASKTRTPGLTAFRLSGRITHRDTATAVAGVRVSAIDRDPHYDQPLGGTLTDEKGGYEITFASAQTGKGEKGGPDLVIIVVDRDGAVLGESKMVRNAAVVTTIDLAVVPKLEPHQSEFEKLLAVLGPALEEVPLAEFTDKDVEFLAAKTASPKDRIETVRAAARVAPALYAPPALVYGLMRKDMGDSAADFARHAPEQLLAAVREAVAEAIIPEITADEFGRLTAMVAHARAGLEPVSQLLAKDVEGASTAAAFLEGRGIDSLDMLKSPEGLLAMTALESEYPGPAVELLRSHASLSTLLPNADLRSTVLALDYRSIGDIASGTVEEFVTATKGKVDSFAAATIHTQALVMRQHLKKNLLEAQLDATRPTRPEARESAVYKVLSAESSCECRDCQSAVSPLPYLADLLKYCYDNVRDTGRPAGRQRVDYLRLGVELHQKFAELPAECGAVEERVHQVRIAVEVLRSFLAAHPPSTEVSTALALAERAYLRAAYEDLLLRIGTTYTDLRLAAVAQDGLRADLADRVGIRQPAGPTDLVKNLLLDVAGTALPALEAKLEELFGLKDTRAAPLSAMPVPKLLTWRRDRLRDTWFTQDWADETAAAGAPIIDPDVIGPDDFRETGATRGAFEIWLRRRRWIDAQLSDLLQRTAGAGSRLDAMLDAMYAAGAAPLPAYPLRGGATAPARVWPSATPKAAFLALGSVLGRGDKVTVARVRESLSQDFGLEVDAYNRASTLIERDIAHRADSRLAALTGAEYRELASILAQARKRMHRANWVGEEQTAQASTDPNVAFQFGPGHFWISLAEPSAGDWPPVDPDARTPWIDPDALKLTDLPDSAVGNAARALWEERRQALLARRAAIAAARRQGFPQALIEAFGTAMPSGFTAWGAFLDDTVQKLGSSTQTDVALAKARLDQTLFMPESTFRRVMVIRARDASADVTQRPGAVEYDEVELLLLGVNKRKALYPAWRSTERSGASALVDWQALKIRMPEWRADPEARAAWQSALRARSKAALIDPDLIGEQHLALALARIPAGAPATGAKPDELAARFWRDRKAALAAKLSAIKTAREQAAASADRGFSAATLAADLAVSDLSELRTLVAAGQGIAKRLAQVGLDRDAFQYLSRIADLITANQIVEPPEWAEVYAILLEVWKRRKVMSWRAGERAAAIALGPDCFKLPQAGSLEFPPPLPPELPRWRASLDRRVAWEDRLQARIDQDLALEKRLLQAVDETEEATLPQLRDALILAVPVTGPANAVLTGLAPKAKALGDRLLIELKGGGCARTTRVAQAIETLQNLLFSIRTGQLLDTYSTWRLTDEGNSAFDGVWTWLGSYATWRAAMFVLLYPENLLVPSLRREGTPEFRNLLQEVRSAGNLSGRTADDATAAFSRYFRDISQLDIAASAGILCAFMDEGRAFPNSITTQVRFLFGVGRQSRRLYWSIVYRGQRDDVQSSWKPFSQFKQDVTKVLGATVYRPSGGAKPYLYVFVTTSENGAAAIQFARFDLLGEGRWAPSDAEQLDANQHRHFTAELLSTSDTVAPAVRVTPDSGPPFDVQLGVDGTAGNVQVSQPAVPATWGDPKTSLVLSAYARQCGGAALRKGAGSSNDLVFFELSTREDGQNYFGHVRVARGLDISGNVGVAGNWATIGTPTTGAGQFGWIFGSSTAGNMPSGCSIAVADVDGDGRDDLIVVYVLPGRQAGDPSTVSCAVGLGLRDDGTAATWVAQSTMFTDAMPNTGPCAVTVLGRTGGAFNLLVAGVGGGDRKTMWLRKIGVTLTNGNTDLAFSNTRSYTQMPPVFNEITGLGLAVADLDGDGTRDLLLHYVEKTGASVSGWLRYASNLDADGFPRGAWTTPISVDSRLYQTIGGTTFSDPSSAALTIGSLSGTPARIDAVIASFPGSNLPIALQYVVARSINLQLAPSLAQSLNTARYKPVLAAPAVGPTFDYRVGPRRDSAVDRAAVWSANGNKTRINQVLLDEAFVFVPLTIALQLQRGGEYIAALDWFRVVFDYTAPRAQRLLYPGLELNPGGSGIWRAENWAWLADPLDPHSIAQGRNGTYRRSVLLVIVRCLLDYADAEFTRDTAESIPLARTLYLTALELLDDEHLKQTYGVCQGIIDRLMFFIGELDDATSAEVKQDLYELFDSDPNLVDLVTLEEPIARANDRGYMTVEEAGLVRKIAKKASTVRGKEPRTLAHVLTAQKALERKLDLAAMGDTGHTTRMALAGVAVGRALHTAFAGAVGYEADLRNGEASLEPGVHALGTAGSTVATVLAGGGYSDPGDTFIGGDFGHLDPKLQGFLDMLPVKLQIIPGSFMRTPPNRHLPREPIEPVNVSPAPPFLSITTCVVPNPILRALRLRAELNLYKIRTCRSITGERRQVEPYAASTDTITGLPSIGAGGQLVLPGLATLSPTPYRYSALLERARNLAQLAQQTESAMLGALQQGDAERYNALKARQDLGSAKAGVKLQTLRIHESQGGIVMAQLQQERAQLQIDQYGEWLSEGLNGYEEAALVAIGISMAINASAAVANFYKGEAGAGLGSLANVSSGLASIFQTLASHERQQDNWIFQRNLAQQDLKIAAQQFYVAQDQVRVVTQEQAIASLTEEHASATIEFLARKFTNTDLYDWMSEVLSGVYRYFLQQATGMARLAAAQLAFERQEAPPPFVKGDYWTPPSDAGSGDIRASDRSGLTGSARLLQDITQLDQYAFATDRRELQLSRTISLLQHAPLEFQRFRETGVLTFATPLEMFDRDFPGHYRRLVRRVKVSVLALTPPSAGIRATLTANRVSRVVVGGDVFQTVRLSHGPEMVALSSPREATGLFELDTQPAMLAPFEKIGVDTTWQLTLPRPANPFDFGSIADVLFTIEYTALHSFDYQQQVLQRLSGRVSARRGWSFRHQFPDQWYDLCNPGLTPTPMTVRFSTVVEDYPRNIEPASLAIDDITLRFVRKTGATFELPTVRLRFEERGAGGFVGGTAGTVDGTINTSSGAAGSWTTMQTRAPMGMWELAVPDDEEMRARFADEEIEDILLVLTYSGRTPAWPA